MKQKVKKFALVMLLVIGITTISKAQFGGSPGGPGSGAPGQPGVPQDNGAVPFDGGLSLILLAAGAGVGTRKRKMNNV